MRVYMDSAELDAQSENVCGKRNMQKGYSSLRHAQIVRLITTWFIKEHRKSGDRKTSAQSNQKMVFKKIMPHSRVCRNIVCLYEACAIDNANRMIRGKSAQPDQINTF